MQTEQNITIFFGALSPSLAEQLAPYELEASKIENFQKLNDSITRLYLNGYCPPSIRKKMEDKLFKAISKEVNAKLEV